MLSLTLVIVALALLLITPIIVDWRVRALQGETDERSRARVLLNDLEAAAIARVLIAQRSGGIGRDTVVEQTAQTTTREVAKDERELDSLVTSSAYTRNELEEIQTIARSWRRAQANPLVRNDTTPASIDPLIAFNAAEVLDDRLTRQLDSTRTEARRLQRINLWSAVILTPIALLSVLAVFTAGRRSRALARHLERERAALADSIEARAGLVRGITHDLKNPLGAAVGYADLLLEGLAGPPLQPDHATTLRRIRRLLRQSIDSIATLVRVADDGGLTDLQLRFEPYDLTALAREAMDDYRAAAVERSLTFEGPVGDATAPIVTDVRHVQHILGNLLSNAVKYTTRGGKVVVRVLAPHDGTSPHARVEVRDSGPGIPVALRTRVFEEFFRADGVPSDTKGNGVGLSISRRLARQLGGDLTVTDASEGGAMFVFDLPVAAPERRRS
jgi:signal transduction histidine kinase